MYSDSASAQAMKTLADALLLRFIGMSQLDDLDEAIWLFECSLALTPKASYLYLELLLSISASLSARYQISKQSHDYTRLLQCISSERGIDLEALLAPVREILSHCHLPIPSNLIRSAQPTSGLDDPHNIHQVSNGYTDNAEASRRNRLFALIIGINEYHSPSIPKLSGAVADAVAMSQYLHDYLGYSMDDITILTDSLATRRSIIAALKNLAEDSRIAAGDPIIIYYAGHGMQIPTLPSAEAGGFRGESIVPYDFSDTRGQEIQVIADSTIDSLLDNIAKRKGNNIVSAHATILAFISEGV